MPGPEHIPIRLGGGLIITGACGAPHLVGQSWSWWQCTTCTRIGILAAAGRYRTERRKEHR